MENGIDGVGEKVILRYLQQRPKERETEATIPFYARGTVNAGDVK